MTEKKRGRRWGCNNSDLLNWLLKVVFFFFKNKKCRTKHGKNRKKAKRDDCVSWPKRGATSALLLPSVIILYI